MAYTEDREVFQVFDIGWIELAGADEKMTQMEAVQWLQDERGLSHVDALLYVCGLYHKAQAGPVQWPKWITTH